MKKKTIYILVILSVLLLFANVILNWTNKVEPLEVNPEISRSIIDSMFINSIAEFNLDSTWISSIPINSSQYDSLKKVYRIKLPHDLRPAVLLVELKNVFLNLPVELISDEKIVNALTTLNILSNNKLKLQATISVENSYERTHSKVAFVLTKFDETNDDIKQSLYHSVFPFSVVLPPSDQSDSIITKLNSYKKSYSILLDDGIEEDKYKLATNLSKTRLKESVRYISWNYASAELVIVNNESKLYNSTVFNFIRDEFISRKINIYLASDFVTLPSNFDESLSLLKFYLESSVGELGKIIIINADNFYKLSDLLLNSKKKGSKFYSPKELLGINLSESNSK